MKAPKWQPFHSPLKVIRVYDLPPYIYKYIFGKCKLLWTRISTCSICWASDPLWNKLWCECAGRTERRLTCRRHAGNESFTPQLGDTIYAVLTRGRNVHVCFLLIFHCWLDRGTEICVTCILEVMKRLRLRRQGERQKPWLVRPSIYGVVTWLYGGYVCLYYEF